MTNRIVWLKHFSETNEAKTIALATVVHHRHYNGISIVVKYEGCGQTHFENRALMQIEEG